MCFITYFKKIIKKMSESDDIKNNIAYKMIVLNDIKNKYNWNEV